MNGLQKTQLTLLTEIDEICRKKSLNYFLANESALSAYRSHRFEGERSTANIYMPFTDALKLRKIIKSEKNPNRMLDSLIDNPNYPDFTFRYSAEDTLYYHITDELGDCYRSHGIFVKICPLFMVSDNEDAELAYRMEEEWRNSHLDSTINIDWSTFKNKRKKRSIIKHLVKVNKDYSFSNQLMYIGLKGKRKIFPKNLFAKVVDVELEGKSFLIPQNSKKYFETLYSFNWMNKSFNGVVSDTFVIDDAVPYKIYLEYLRANNISCNPAKINKIVQDSKKQSAPLIKPLNTAWSNVKLIVAKRVLADKYLPKKDEITNLLVNEDWQNLDEALSEYEHLCLSFASSNQLLAFDDELLDALITLEQHKGNSLFAKKIVKMAQLNK